MDPVLIANGAVFVLTCAVFITVFLKRRAWGVSDQSFLVFALGIVGLAITSLVPFLHIRRLSVASIVLSVSLTTTSLAILLQGRPGQLVRQAAITVGVAVLAVLVVDHLVFSQ